MSKPQSYPICLVCALGLAIASPLAADQSNPDLSALNAAMQAEMESNAQDALLLQSMQIAPIKLPETESSPDQVQLQQSLRAPVGNEDSLQSIYGSMLSASNFKSSP